MIPTSFKACGYDIEVQLVPQNEWYKYDPGDKHRGLYLADRNLIVIREEMHDQRIQQTLLHEVVHVILGIMEHPLDNDEPFIEAFSHVLHQIFTTMETATKRSKRK